MPALARLIIAALLALAIPVQAMSAVMARICMASDHHQVEAASQHDDHSDHDHDDGATVSDSHCPPCVACCAAAAISASACTFAPERPAAGPIGAAPYLAAGIQLDGLDRPPVAL